LCAVDHRHLERLSTARSLGFDVGVLDQLGPADAATRQARRRSDDHMSPPLMGVDGIPNTSHARQGPQRNAGKSPPARCARYEVAIDATDNRTALVDRSPGSDVRVD